jgi:hypothetical protein
MKFMLISYATKDWEAGLPPDPRLVAAIPRLYEKMPKGASLLSTGGLAPTSLGAKVRVSGGNVVVIDGPFAETKEVVGGFAIVEASSKEEAIEIARGFWELHVDVWVPPTRVGEKFARCSTWRNVPRRANGSPNPNKAPRSQ